MSGGIGRVETKIKDPLEWLKGILHEVQTMPKEKIWVPEYDPTEDDPKATIVGDVPDDLKRLFSLYRDASAKASVAKAFAETARTSEERERLEVAATELHYKYTAMKTIFWTSAQVYLGIWDGNKSLSITSKWKFGVSESEPEPGLEGLLNRLRNAKAVKLG